MRARLGGLSVHRVKHDGDGSVLIFTLLVKKIRGPTCIFGPRGREEEGKGARDSELQYLLKTRYTAFRINDSALPLGTINVQGPLRDGQKNAIPANTANCKITAPPRWSADVFLCKQVLSNANFSPFVYSTNIFILCQRQSFQLTPAGKMWTKEKARQWRVPEHRQTPVGQTYLKNGATAAFGVT